MTAIKGFFGDHRWLSNFHPAKVQNQGESYPSTEHTCKATKHLDPAFRSETGRYTSPRDAMQADQDLLVLTGMGSWWR